MPLGQVSGSMRDRRGCNLSISSLSSEASSPASPVITATSLDDAEKGRFLWAPPSTPGQALPSPLLKHARASDQAFVDKFQSRLGWRRLLLIVMVVSLFLCHHCLSWIDTRPALDAITPLQDRKFFHRPGTRLPQDPTPLIFQDDTGTPKWTVSIPHAAAFPLRPHQYRNVCQASERVSKSVESMSVRSRVMSKSYRRHTSYYAVDENFVDVADAQRLGFLHTPEHRQSIVPVGASPGLMTEDTPVCDRSLTFVMESDQGGFGHSLLSLWLAYGLAKKEGRAFFLDDSNWPYGDYTAYFPAPPQPACSPPPAHEILPCPHSARHLIVSAATMSWTFGSAFKNEFANPRRSGVDKDRAIYDLLRSGYDDLFGLLGEDAAFAAHQSSVLRRASERSGIPVVGMHIRRGDVHPYELQFSNDYLPFERYTSAAAKLVSDLTAPNSTHQRTLLLASDDPDIFDSIDLTSTLPANMPVARVQERIVLASKKSLAPAVPLRNGAYTKHVDENSGWEGGFYSALFFGLGGGSHSTSSSSDHDDLPPTAEEQAIMQQAMALRELVGRGYLLDLEVLSKADAVVCASSSAACRLLAVMMGWDKVVSGMWKNVDAGRYWTWDGQL